MSSTLGRADHVPAASSQNSPLNCGGMPAVSTIASGQAVGAEDRGTILLDQHTGALPDVHRRRRSPVLAMLSGEALKSSIGRRQA